MHLSPLVSRLAIEYKRFKCESFYHTARDLLRFTAQYCRELEKLIRAFGAYLGVRYSNSQYYLEPEFFTLA